MSITPAPMMPSPTNPATGLSPIEQCPGAAGRGDVTERVAAEGLAAHDGEHADHGGHDGDRGAHRGRGVDGRAGEEPGLEDLRPQLVHGVSPPHARDRP